MRSATTRRADYRHFQRHTTRWGDNDPYGHLNNVIHYALFDSTVIELLISKALLDPGTSKSIGLVVETGCRYFRELAYPFQISAGRPMSDFG